MIKLKPAVNADDLELISKLSDVIWHEYYPEIVTVEQIDYMLNKYHTAEALQNQISSGQKFFLITENDEAIGYCSFSEKDEAAFLHKFYILSGKRRSGAGSIIFEQILELLNGNQKISLQVNRKNFKSVNFYFKHGFTIEYVKDFDIGNGYLMEDFIMTRNISRQ